MFSAIRVSDLGVSSILPARKKQAVAATWDHKQLSTLTSKGRVRLCFEINSSPICHCAVKSAGQKTGAKESQQCPWSSSACTWWCSVVNACQIWQMMLWRVAVSRSEVSADSVDKSDHEPLLPSFRLGTNPITSRRAICNLICCV